MSRLHCTGGVSSEGMGDSWYVNFRGCIVYESDATLLEDRNWLNDSLLLFAMLRLEERHANPSLAFMDPCVVSYLNCQCASDAERVQFGADNNLGSKSHLLVPITNSTSFDRSSTHWSLLVIETASRVCAHFDSCQQSNYEAALATTRNLLVALCLPHNSDLQLIKAKSPHQQNSYDCGVYTILFADVLARSISESQQAARNDGVSTEQLLLSAVTPQRARELRLALQEAVLSLEKHAL